MAKSAFKKPFVQGAKEFFTGLSGSRTRDDDGNIVTEDGQSIFSERSQNLNIQKLIANFDSGARPNRYDVNLFCSNLNIVTAKFLSAFKTPGVLSTQLSSSVIASLNIKL